MLELWPRSPPHTPGPSHPESTRDLTFGASFRVPSPNRATEVFASRAPRLGLAKSPLTMYSKVTAPEATVSSRSTFKGKMAPGVGVMVASSEGLTLRWPWAAAAPAGTGPLLQVCFRQAPPSESPASHRGPLLPVHLSHGILFSGHRGQARFQGLRTKSGLLCESFQRTGSAWSQERAICKARLT